MISLPDLDALRESFATWDEPGLPVSLAGDCARLLDVTDATISFVGATDQLTLCASSDDAQTLDDWEFTLGEGPGLDAATTSTSTMADTAPNGANAWPRLSAKAHAMGYKSIAGVPLEAGGTTYGCIGLQDRLGTITADMLADAEHLASELASLVLASLNQPLPSLDHSVDHDTFHQATGMVMAQMGIDGDGAVGVLRAYSLSHDRLLMDTASQVVARTLTFPLTRPSSV